MGKQTQWTSSIQPQNLEESKLIALHAIIWRDIILSTATDLEKADKAELYLRINPSLNKVNHE